MFDQPNDNHSVKNNLNNIKYHVKCHIVDITHKNRYHKFGGDKNYSLERLVLVAVSFLWVYPSPPFLKL